MTPNFLHIRGSYDDARSALNEWLGKEIDPAEHPLDVEDNGWNTISIDLDYQETTEWLKLASRRDFFYESYSTSLRMGEIVFCREQQLLRHLLLDEENPDQNLNVGQLPSEKSAPLESWSDIWGYVDDWKWIKDI